MKDKTKFGQMLWEGFGMGLATPPQGDCRPDLLKETLADNWWDDTIARVIQIEKDDRRRQ